MKRRLTVVALMAVPMLAVSSVGITSSSARPTAAPISKAGGTAAKPFHPAVRPSPSRFGAAVGPSPSRLDSASSSGPSRRAKRGAPRRADPVIAAAGDIACDPTSEFFNDGFGDAEHCRMKDTSDLLLGRDLAAVLPLGDTQYSNGKLAKFQKSYDPTWGRVKSITRPAIGNHEYRFRSGEGYAEYFGPAAGNPLEKIYYYSYDIGRWHLIALDSNCNRLPAGTGSHGCDEGSPQNDWLEQDLADHPSDCTLAYAHHPRFSQGEEGPTPPLDETFEDLYRSGVDILLSGHNHVYERFVPRDPDGQVDPARGVRQVVVGTGGKSHGAFKDPRRLTEARNSDTYGVFFLTLRPRTFEWEFTPIAGQTFTDSGRGVCH